MELNVKADNVSDPVGPKVHPTRDVVRTNSEAIRISVLNGVGKAAVGNADEGEMKWAQSTGIKSMVEIEGRRSRQKYKPYRLARDPPATESLA